MSAAFPVMSGVISFLMSEDSFLVGLSCFWRDCGREHWKSSSCLPAEVDRLLELAADGINEFLAETFTLLSSLLAFTYSVSRFIFDYLVIYSHKIKTIFVVTYIVFLIWFSSGLYLKMGAFIVRNWLTSLLFDCGLRVHFLDYWELRLWRIIIACHFLPSSSWSWRCILLSRVSFGVGCLNRCILIVNIDLL